MIRFFDVIISLIILIVFSPVLIIIYLWVIIDSRGGGFFLQKRVGKNGKDFQLMKFRTMYINSEKSGLITIGENDSRLTKAGFVLRKTKLDELPQFFNVLKGDMSIVGPRPEVRKYVNLYNETQLRVLDLKPGITDYASIKYSNENEILGKSEQPEFIYIHELMPDKLNLNMIYVNNQTVYEYFRIIFLTIRRLVKN